MARILVANECSETLVGDLDGPGPEWMSHRVLWFIQPSDIVVLADSPEESFLNYVCKTVGVPRDEFAVLVPRMTRNNDTRLTRDRLLDPAFLKEVASAIASVTVTEIVPLWPSREIADFALACGERARRG